MRRGKESRRAERLQGQIEDAVEPGLAQGRKAPQPGIKPLEALLGARQFVEKLFKRLGSDDEAVTAEETIGGGENVLPRRRADQDFS